MTKHYFKLYVYDLAEVIISIIIANIGTKTHAC